MSTYHVTAHYDNGKSFSFPIAARGIHDATDQALLLAPRAGSITVEVATYHTEEF